MKSKGKERPRACGADLWCRIRAACSVPRPTPSILPLPDPPNQEDVGSKQTAQCLSPVVPDQGGVLDAQQPGEEAGAGDGEEQQGHVVPARAPL
jgi:hypothetical protein